MRGHSQRGYLLVEVIVATLIFSMMALGAAGLFSRSLATINDTRQYTVATALAQKQLEMLKGWPPNQWKSVGLPAIIPWQGSDNPAPFVVLTDAMLCPEDPVNLVQVTVTVSWSGNSMVMSAHYPQIDLEK